MDDDTYDDSADRDSELNQILRRLSVTPAQRLRPPENATDRSRGFVTENDRKFLSGNWSSSSEHAAQIRSNRKSDIRERTANAIQDFPYLLAVDSDQRTRIYDELGRDTTRRSLGSLITFIYLASEKDDDLIKEAVADGIYTGEREVPTSVPGKKEIEDVRVYFDIEYAPNADSLYQRFKEEGPSALSPGEVGVLVQQKNLSQDELIELNKPEEVRLAEKAAAKIENAIDESDADTYAGWKAGLTIIDRDGDLDPDQEYAHLVEFESTHPNKDIHDFLDDKYVTDSEPDDN